MKQICFVLLLYCVVSGDTSYAQAEGSLLSKLKGLTGEWEAQGDGKPGQGSGNFSFQYDLDNKIVLRKSTTEYPSSSGTKAMAHKDMMVIYSQPHEASLKAIYFDNEGHIIDYTSQFPDEKTIQFTSKLLPGRPAFRLTYIFSDTDNMTINFEISSNGNEDNFKSYVTGSARRKK